MITFHAMRSKEEWAWLKKRAEVTFTETTRGIAAYEDGKVIGAVAMDAWTPNSCMMHIAVDNMLIFKHGFPEEVFRHIFLECDKGVIVGATPAHMESVLRFNKHVGFKEVYRIPDGYEVGIDMVIQECRKENCKYLRNIDGQVNSRRS